MGGAQAMKINAKIDGINWIVNSQPLPWTNKPYIVFGKRHARVRIHCEYFGVLQGLLSPETCMGALLLPDQHGALTTQAAPRFPASSGLAHEEQGTHSIPPPGVQAQTSRTSRALATPLPAWWRSWPAWTAG